MEYPNASVVSSVRADYGSTTLEGSNTHEDDEGFTGNFNYQSLPHSSTTNLFERTQRLHLPRSMSARQTKLTMDPQARQERRQLIERLEIFCNVLNQICIGFVTIYVSWVCLRIGLAGTALHAWLVTIGFVFLMAEGIMAHYGNNVLTNSYKRTTKTTIHWILQALGGSLGVIGTLIKMIQKGFLLTSIHGKLGFAAFIICLVSMVSGLGALFSTKVKKILSPLLNKTIHIILGIATFAIALLAQYYGYQTGFFSRKVSDDFQVLIKCVTLLSLILTSIGPMKALSQKMYSIIMNFS